MKPQPSAMQKTTAQTFYRCPVCGEPSSRPSRHLHYRNGKRYPIAYVVPFVAIVLLLFVIVLPAAYMMHNTVQKERTAILPVKVWEALSENYICWILPGETYTVADNYSVGDWTPVVSVRCKGIAQVRPSR